MKPWNRACSLAIFLVVLGSTQAEQIQLTSTPADFDRWMYPFNSTPGTRPSSSVFGAFGTDTGVDTRDGQFVVGWDTASKVPSGRGFTNYLIRSAKITLTINRDLAWEYDGTLDSVPTYLSTNDSRYIPDSDPGRPVELFGAGFRNGFTAATFPESGPFTSGSDVLGTRNVYSAGYDTNGALVDVSNSVGKEDSAAFETIPFAVGVAAGLNPGDRVPTGQALVFNFDLTNPFVVDYLRDALNQGHLRSVASCLLEANFTSGAPNYPQFYTRDNLLATASEIPLLDLDVTIISTDDSDQDLLPDDWEKFYFGGLTHSGSEDADADGADNLAEFNSGTDPHDRTSCLEMLRIVAGPTGASPEFRNIGRRNYMIEHTADLLHWEKVIHPVLTFPEPRKALWNDPSPPGDLPRYYRIGIN